MLAATLAYADRYDFQSERFQKAFAFLRRADLADLPLGRCEIDGDEVFANILRFDTVPAAQKAYEAHKRYFDIQFVISGEEAIAVAPVDEVEPIQEYDEADDYCLYGEPASCAWLPLHAHDLVILGPEEAHKPGCDLAGSATVHKVVVKVAV